LARYFKAKITDNTLLNNKTFLLTVQPLEPVIEPAPGQFYMIETGDSYDPLLKRPFSYVKKNAEWIQFLYAVRGKGTSLMKTFKSGRIINIIGPLGNGYPKPQAAQIPLLIAGGTGVASIFSLCSELPEKYVVYGAQCKGDLLLLDELQQLNDQLIVCTNDCSFGNEGMVDKTLNDFLDTHASDAASYVIYACGPKPMLEAVAKIAAEKKIKGYVSLEEKMGCGFGACLGCAVKTTKGYKRVCKEGPIFPLEEIVW
jgi:dihydroorotate dehydrogenase electron transfer subunit